MRCIQTTEIICHKTTSNAFNTQLFTTQKSQLTNINVNLDTFNTVAADQTWCRKEILRVHNGKTTLGTLLKSTHAHNAGTRTHSHIYMLGHLRHCSNYWNGVKQRTDKKFWLNTVVASSETLNKQLNAIRKSKKLCMALMPFRQQAIHQTA